MRQQRARRAAVNVRDIVGWRSATTRRTLRQLRLDCLRDLREEAKALDADAVIAVRLSYSEFAAHGRSMLFLVTTGTAAQLERLASIPFPTEEMIE